MRLACSCMLPSPLLLVQISGPARRRKILMALHLSLHGNEHRKLNQNQYQLIQGTE